MLLAADICRQARLSRDARFDGRFFVGVLTTGIYCRPICPAVAASEKNVRYFASAAAAANAGLRPCLRCRPESAPGSYAWRGTRTTLERAIRLIEQGALNGDDAQAVTALATRLGISSRWLRQLFADALGVSPLQYAIYCRLLFAKQLLHETELPMTQVALAAGFNSVRRFNEVFQQRLQLAPSALRQRRHGGAAEVLQLSLSYRPPLAWVHMVDFFRTRAVPGMEWFEQQGQSGYGRTLHVQQHQQQLRGWFFARQDSRHHRLHVTVALLPQDALALLPLWLQRLRQLLDLDADPQAIQQGLHAIQQQLPALALLPGLRLPGCASLWEAGVRAVLGQQVSLRQATQLLTRFVQQTATPMRLAGRECCFFPDPAMVADAGCPALPMPQSRRQTLHTLALALQQHGAMADTTTDWLTLKGIGPWTVAYSAMRGQGAPDILLGGDLVIKKQLQSLAVALPHLSYRDFYLWLAHAAAPWGSYLTLNLWHLANSAASLARLGAAPPAGSNESLT